MFAPRRRKPTATPATMCRPQHCQPTYSADRFRTPCEVFRDSIQVVVATVTDAFEGFFEDLMLAHYSSYKQPRKRLTAGPATKPIVTKVIDAKGAASHFVFGAKNAGTPPELPPNAIRDEAADAGVTVHDVTGSMTLLEFLENDSSDDETDDASTVPNSMASSAPLIRSMNSDDTRVIAPDATQSIVPSELLGAESSDNHFETNSVASESTESISLLELPEDDDDARSTVSDSTESIALLETLDAVSSDDEVETNSATSNSMASSRPFEFPVNGDDANAIVSESPQPPTLSASLEDESSTNDFETSSIMSDSTESISLLELPVGNNEDEAASDSTESIALLETLDTELSDDNFETSSVASDSADSIALLELPADINDEDTVSNASDSMESIPLLEDPMFNHDCFIKKLYKDAANIAKNFDARAASVSSSTKKAPNASAPAQEMTSKKVEMPQNTNTDSSRAQTTSPCNTSADDIVKPSIHQATLPPIVPRPTPVVKKASKNGISSLIKLFDANSNGTSRAFKFQDRPKTLSRTTKGVSKAFH